MQPYSRLISHLQKSGPLAVAFSGGVDSTLLLKAAHDALGDQAIAITIDGPMQFRRELAEARNLAALIGVRQIEIPLYWPELTDLHLNPKDRCYRCKRRLFMRCRNASPADYTLCDGSTADDLHPHRPGHRALGELTVASPLQLLGYGKGDIRALSRELGLPSWDKPAQSCLLTRFPHNAAIRETDLQRVEACEEALHDLGFTVVRARCLGDTARLEFGADELPAACTPAMQAAIQALCAKAGFAEAIIDPSGYRSGNMD